MAQAEKVHMTLLNMFPHKAGLNKYPLYPSFPYPAHMNTTVHFIGSGETCYKTSSRVWHSKTQLYDSRLYSKMVGCTIKHKCKVLNCKARLKSKLLDCTVRAGRL